MDITIEVTHAGGIYDYCVLARQEGVVDKPSKMRNERGAVAAFVADNSEYLTDNPSTLTLLGVPRYYQDQLVMMYSRCKLIFSVR